MNFDVCHNIVFYIRFVNSDVYLHDIRCFKIMLDSFSVSHVSSC